MSQMNQMNYVTISSTGNGADFGDLYEKNKNCGVTSNGTNERGIVYGGSRAYAPCSANWRHIDYFTINSLGNSTDFGDMPANGREGIVCTSNLTNERGIAFGGTDHCAGAVNSNIIQYITISSTGDASDFGDISAGTTTECAATSDGVLERGVMMGGSGLGNTIGYVTISSTGNTTDFGDLLASLYGGQACSNAD